LWEEHLLPLLTCKDAARLACTCKALRGVVREQFKDLGVIKVDKLQAALTTFPRARGVTLDRPVRDLDDTEVEALVEWLQEGGRGRGLERMTIKRNTDGHGNHLAHKALREGALPSLRSLDAHLLYPTHRALLTEGLVEGMHELQLKFSTGTPDRFGPMLAALGVVRQLPALARLGLQLTTHTRRDFAVPWPSFIPPSLKALRIVINCASRECGILRALASMLETSGARLDRLEVALPPTFDATGDGLIHLAQALRCCSPTLRGFHLNGFIAPRFDAPDRADQMERLRVQWTDVMAGVSACRELQVLVLPYIEVEPLFPPGTAFRRLTHLAMWDHEREHPPDAGVMGLWEMVASGGLPTLAKLKATFHPPWGGIEKVRSRVAPALEAVAGTLTHLQLGKVDRGGWLNEEVDVVFELGVAVGKLRRLKDLALDLSQDGQVYHALGQGLAASGGDGPLPLLWRVRVVPSIKTNPDLLANLLLPSVRIFCSYHARSAQP
jgi:hypothetical protein